MEKYILSNLKDKKFSRALNDVYEETDYNHKQYPNYYKWFYYTNLKRIFENKGEVFIYKDGYQLAGLAIVKNTNEEKKICTLLIIPEYRKLGGSEIILNDIFNYLKTEHPLITIPYDRLDEFSGIINKYGWKLSGETDKYYSREQIFNDDKIVLPEKQKILLPR